MSGEAGPDPYLDPASGVLRNLLGITDAGELAQVEAALSASRLVDLERRGFPANTTWVTCGRSTATSSATSSNGLVSCGQYRSPRDRCSACRST